MATTSVADGTSVRALDLEALRLEASTFDIDNDAGFSAVLKRTRMLFQMSDGDLAEELLVSRPTVNRWLNGRNLPHRAMRRPIFEWIADEAARRLRMGSNDHGRRSGAAAALERA